MLPELEFRVKKNYPFSSRLYRLRKYKTQIKKDKHLPKSRTEKKDCKFRNCHAPRQTIKFNNSNFSQNRWYPKLTKGLDFKTSEPIVAQANNTPFCVA